MSEVEERLVEALIAPIRDVGVLLAKEIDKLRADHDAVIAEVREEIRALKFGGPKDAA